MNIAITYLLLLLPTLTHIIFDYSKRYTGGKIRHWLSALIAVSMSVILGFTDKSVYFWQFAGYALAIHFCYFDPLWNKANRHDWHYNGDRTNPERAWTDKMWDRVPIYAQPFIRLWVLAVGYSVYYHLDLIIG